MNQKEAMAARHSVRQYKRKPLEPEIAAALQAEAEACNQESGLSIQLVINEPDAFNSRLAHYGKFKNVSNYFALVGKKEPSLEEKCGYYGQRLVLAAQQLGLNTCWTALTYSKRKVACSISPGEKLCIVIALGYGETQGVPHPSKSFEQVVSAQGQIPAWFKAGTEAALLAPTAMNQQKFHFTLHGSQVTATAGLGFYTKIDLGIAKYQFELGAGKENFTWG